MRITQKPRSEPEQGADRYLGSSATCSVLFSAAMLGTVNVEALCAFTGYGPEYVGAIAENMTINRLWVGDRYDVSKWLRNGSVDDYWFLGQDIQNGDWRHVVRSGNGS
jgi:hypothetical protein